MTVSRRRLLLAGALGLSWTPFGLAGCGDNTTPVDPPANGTGNTTAPGAPTPPSGNTTEPGGNTTAPGDTTGGNTTEPGGNTTEPGGGTTTPPPGTTPPSSGPRIRYDLRSSQGQAMLAIYARGVAAMMALPDTDPRSWTWWWYTHMVRGGASVSGELNRIFGGGVSPAKTLAGKTWGTCQSHNGQDENFFLPWHRMFVLAFENIIRQVTAEPDFTLPYWSYTDTGGSVIPSQFRRPGDATWGALYRSTRGGPGKNVNGGAPIQPAGILNLDILNTPTYAPDGADQGFCNNLDQGLHGYVHVGVGVVSNFPLPETTDTGMGAVAWAANDPIFWVHHCNIDRIWASWNRGGGVNPTETAFVNKPFVFAGPAGDQVSYTVGNFLSTGAPGYSYDRLEGDAVQAMAMTMAAPPPAAAGGSTVTVRSARRSLPMLNAAPSPMAAPSARVSAVARLQGVVATPSITHIAQAITLGATATRVTLSQAVTAQAAVARALPATGMILKSLRRSAPPMVGAAAPSTRVASAAAAAPSAPAAAAAAPAQTVAAPGPGQRALLVLNGLGATNQPGVLYNVYLEAPTAGGGREKILVGSVSFFSVMTAMAGMTMSPKRSRGISFDITAIAQRLAAAGRLEASPQISFVPIGNPAKGVAPTVSTVSLAVQ